MKCFATGPSRGGFRARLRKAVLETNLEDIRSLSAEESKKLEPGAHHYRAYVGDPQSYDITGANQFSLLVSLGLREEHTLLDVGCGSLCGGRLFIPYLLPGRYCGIEPEDWLIQDGIRREVSSELSELKKPRFVISDSFEFSKFKEKFDFIVSQSVLTHVSLQQLEICLSKARDVLKKDGLFSASFYYNGKDKFHEGEWIYPEFSSFSPKFVFELAKKHDLSCHHLIRHSNYGHYWIVFFHRASAKSFSWIGTSDDRSSIFQILELKRELADANEGWKKAIKRAKRPVRIRPRDRLAKT